MQVHFKFYYLILHFQIKNMQFHIILDHYCYHIWVQKVWKTNKQTLEKLNDWIS